MVTDDEEILGRASQLRTFGEKPGGDDDKLRPYTSCSVGYQYRTQEFPAAFARSQLKRLAGVNENAVRNGEYLTDQLNDIPGLLPPCVPKDRKSIYHKYRLRFDLHKLGITMPATEFRMRLLDALRAEGVSVDLWQVDPLPAFPIFQKKQGWGKGCPWSCSHYGREITYRREDYPQAIKLLDESIIVADEETPLYCQDLQLMQYYVKAFRKVFDNLDELLD